MSGVVSTVQFVSEETPGVYSLHVLVDGMHCHNCVAAIENALRRQEGITSARINLSTKRLKLNWQGVKEQADKWVALVNAMGYRAVAFDPDTLESQEKREEKFLLVCLGVSGFATCLLMLLAEPVWLDEGEMGKGTLALFYWLQALVAIPASAWCGLPFYRSAWAAIKDRRSNMDVPISVAIILSLMMSVFEAINHGRHAYFDSAVMLIFFLLIGRYLDTRARGRARSAAHDLLQMMAGSATVLHADGSQETIPLSGIREGMTLLVAAGEKIGADAEVMRGESDIDTSLITGETLPQKVTAGSKVFAGTINLSLPLTLSVTRAGEHSMLAGIIRLMEAAEQSQARYVAIADRISGWYTPVVHGLALATFLGWWLPGYAIWQTALLYAVTVLIITCPCALGLAVPVVQVLASGRLMRQGILLKSGSALERLAEITHVAFDKTGTLTLGKAELLGAENHAPEMLQLAASMAAHSRHPLSQALTRAYTGRLLPLSVSEIKGQGLESYYGGRTLRLGRRSWVAPQTAGAMDDALELWLAMDASPPQRFRFADQLRGDATEVVKALQAAHMNTLLLSGDREEVVKTVAAELGISEFRAGLLPTDKCEALEQLKRAGAKVLMVGDGLNDAPSLASAYVSMSPASAMDITQNAADIVFQGERLKPVLTSWKVARFAQRLVKSNFVLSIGYNVIAIPLAVLGYITPLLAAIAMSSSSLIVIANAMRLNLMRDDT